MTSFDRLEPVTRETTAGVIASRIREGIRDGTFPPGSQLGEAQLAQQLQVSRGPVREALQRLIQEGLVRSEPHRGVFVRELDADEVRDVYLARAAIERAAVALVARAASHLVVAELGKLVERMERAADRDRWSAVADLDLQFHQVLVEASGSRRLLRMFDTLLIETRLCLGALEAAYPVRHEIVEEHRDLHDAIASGSEEQAVALVERHLEDAVRHLGE